MGAASSVADATVSAKNNGQGGHVKVANADYVIESLKLSNQHLIASLQRMLNVRHFEEQCQKAFRGNKVGGYLHLYIGQEAVSLGVVDSCKPGDQFLSSYRDHAHCLFLGSDPGAVMSEIFGKATGVSRGKGGSMHLFDKAHGFAGGYGIVGGNVPLSIGIGWALKYQGTDNICVCFIGDGAMNSGAFHESLNMAALYKLPVLFLLENNHYAMGTSVERSHANTDLASRADSYGIPHSKVDGQDYFAMRAECEEVVSKMRTDSSPYFLEAVTYRYVGHGAADDSKTQATYRDHSEVDEWKLRDPVAIFSNALKTRGIISDEEFDRMDHSAVEAGRRAAEFAEESRTCSPEELTEDVYV